MTQSHFFKVCSTSSISVDTDDPNFEATLFRLLFADSQLVACNDNVPVAKCKEIKVVREQGENVLYLSGVNGVVHSLAKNTLQLCIATTDDQDSVYIISSPLSVLGRKCRFTQGEEVVVGLQAYEVTNNIVMTSVVEVVPRAKRGTPVSPDSRVQFYPDSSASFVSASSQPPISADEISWEDVSPLEDAELSHKGVYTIPDISGDDDDDDDEKEENGNGKEMDFNENKPFDEEERICEKRQATKVPRSVESLEQELNEIKKDQCVIC